MVAEMSDAFAAKLAGRPGMTIFDDFQAVETARGEPVELAAVPKK